MAYYCLPLFGTKSTLRCVLLLCFYLLRPSLAFGASQTVQKANNNQAAQSKLFRNINISQFDNSIMAKQRKSPPSRLVPFASASSSTTAEESPEQDKVTWKDRLLKVSNIASILCVIDCTVLPIVTVIMPLLGLAAFTPAQMEWLHHLGHEIAMWFVIPVGGTAAALNYSTHKQWKYFMPALLGLLLIYLANGAGHGGLLLGRLPHDLVHKLHCGSWQHRVTNIAGCALLLTSNYKSHQATHAHGDCCHHDH